MTARNLSIPQRKPATQSRPMEKAAAGGMSARQVGPPADGCRTAAAFFSFGAAATNLILARDRHRDNGEVRRLGFAPIPGRRFNSVGALDRPRSRSCLILGTSKAVEAGRISRHLRSSVRTGKVVRRFPTLGFRWDANGQPVQSGPYGAEANSNPGAFRGERAVETRQATEAQRCVQRPDRLSRLGLCRYEDGRARNSFSRCSTLGERNRAGRHTPDMYRRPALPLASGDALFMGGLAHGRLGSAI